MKPNGKESSPCDFYLDFVSKVDFNQGSMVAGRAAIEEVVPPD